MKLIRVNSKKRTKKRFSANCEVLPQLIKGKIAFMFNEIVEINIKQ